MDPGFWWFFQFSGSYETVERVLTAPSLNPVSIQALELRLENYGSPPAALLLTDMHELRFTCERIL